MDLVEDLSMSTFLRCLKRFAARRGLPLKFLSDNGKTFRLQQDFLNFSSRITHQGISCYQGQSMDFNVERAPWWGGVFERMVRSTKRCLRKTIGRAHFSQDELHVLTALVEIEGVINSRPLSYVTSSDFEEPLTPSHRIVGRRLFNLPDYAGLVDDPYDEEFEVDAAHLQRRAKHLASVLNHYWHQWRAEYLNELRDGHRYTAKRTPGASHQQVSKGDIVIVHDESLPRGLWKLGRIQELLIGQDGLPRSALVRVATRDQQYTLLKRPLQLLYPLEVAGAQETETSVEQSQQDGCPTPSKVPVAVKRPCRVAAMKANERMKALAQEEELEIED